MTLPHRVRRAFRLLVPGAYRDEVDEELRCHLEMKAEELAEAGMDPEAAAREARRRFGDPDRIARECRSIARTREAAERRAGLRDELLQDLRWAARRLAGERGFALAMVAILALGIGAATALFSVADAVLFRPLPYPEPERLVRITETTPEGDGFTVSLPNLFDWRRESESFSGIAGLELRLASLVAGDGEPRQIQLARATEDLFELLGMRPVLGDLMPADAFAPGGDDSLVVLSHELWRRGLGADPRAVGAIVMLDGRSVRVAGVLPPGVAFEGAEAWTPLREDPDWERDNKDFAAFGRLASGVSLEAAEADLAAIAARLGERHPEANRGWSVRLTGLHEFLVGPQVHRTLLVLLGAVGLLLLIACVNISSLLVARGAGRAREMAVRVSLGAPRRRLVRQLLVEAAALGLLGGLSGLALAWAAVEAVGRFAPPGVPRLAEAGLDGRVLAFSIAAALLSSLLFGLLPALQTSRTRPGEDLRAGGRTSAAATARTRAVLVVTQLALAVTLLVGAGLTARSYLRLLGVDLGFDAGDVLAVRVDLPEADFPAARRQALAEEIRGRLAALPGVEAAAATVGGLYSGFGLANEFAVPGSQPLATGGNPVAQWRIVTPGYFEALDVPLLRGRRIEEGDGEGKAFVVNRAFAESFWPGEEDVVGRRIHFGGADPGDDPYTVVGVVGDVRDTELSEAPLPTVYASYQKIPWMFQTWLVEAEEEPAAVASAVRAELRRLLPGVPVPEVLPLTGDLGRARANPRFQALLMAAFALAAASLAAAGVYGQMAFAVARRTREIGIRLALGARQATVVRMIARQGAVLVAVGTALGLAGALALARTLESLLYETAPAEPATYAAAAGLLAGAALLAAYLPARRAAAVDPTTALAAE